MSDLMAGVSAITFIVVSLLIIFGGGYFSYWVIRKIFWNDETIIIFPTLFSITLGFFFFIETLLLTIILTYQLRYRPYEINVENVRRLLPLFVIVVVLCFIGTFLSFTVFQKDKIIFRNIFHIFGKKYTYNDVIRIEVFMKKYTRIEDRLKYLIIMKDGRKIDLNTLQLQGGKLGVKEHEISFKKIVYIESLINEDIPHDITHEAYSRIKSTFFCLPEGLHKRFRKRKNH
jgi:hypothetical protein